MFEWKNAKIIKYSTNTIFTDKTLKSKSQKDNTLMSSKDENENEKENDNGNENENERTKH